jgi:hypothetical protein
MTDGDPTGRPCPRPECDGVLNQRGVCEIAARYLPDWWPPQISTGPGHTHSLAEPGHIKEWRP